MANAGAPSRAHSPSVEGGGVAAGRDKSEMRANVLRMAEQKAERAWVSHSLTKQLPTSRNCRSLNVFQEKTNPLLVSAFVF